MSKDHVDLTGFFAILTLTFLWGLNYTAIKFSNAGLSPIFTTFLRSGIASGCGILYCLAIRQPLFQTGVILFHGVVVGVLFGLEFVCLYLGVLYTDASRAVVLVYSAPIMVAAGAHFLLRERLNVLKASGLVLAFLGIYLVFRGKPRNYGELMLLGDVLEVMAAALWAATTLYIKKYLAPRVHPINTFLYQLVFSVPIILFAAYAIEDHWVTKVDVYVTVSVVYQSLIVAFASFFAWFKLIHVYPVGALSAFTFLTPVFGVLFGAVILKEQLTAGLIVGLVLVSVGIYCTNHTKPQGVLRRNTRGSHNQRRR